MLKKFVSLALCCILMLISFCSCNTEQGEQNNLQKFSATYIEYFDTASTIVGYEETEEEFDAICEFIEKELKTYNNLYDIYKSYEGVNNIRTINLNAGKEPVKVDKRIIDLLDYCKEIYAITDGTVNVAMGSVLSIWHDYRTWGINSPSTAELPPIERLKAAAKHTDIEKIVIDRENGTIFLSDGEMLLDVGAVAKGYATECIAKALKEKGVDKYALNIGGNIRTIGTKGDGTPWSAAVTNPDKTSEKPYLMSVSLNDQVFVTSGSYERFYTVKGVNYHHIINPETLMPENTFSSISILAKDSGLADSLSTAVFNMTYEEGEKLIESLDGVEAMWVTSENEILYSDGFKDIIIE